MKKTVFLLIGLIFLTAGLCLADEGFTKAAKAAPETAVGGSSKERCLEAIEFMTGYSWGDLKRKDDYGLVPFLVAFDFNLKPLTEKFNFSPRSLLQFQIEPFLGYISSPESNFEMGTSFFLKFGLLPQTSKIQPYIKAGIGLDYMTLHTNEQSTQFNFISTGAVGTHVFLKENVALTLEGRYRHLSNASIDEPNSGINTYWGTVGILYQF